MITEHPETTAVEPALESSRESPGALIREARTRMQLSIDDLAGQTKLARHTLEALERDDFAALLEAVYVRGYYRKCAKVLGLPEQRLLDAYSTRVLPKSPLPPAKLRLASGTELGSSSRLPVPLAIGAAVVAVVVCGFVWVARESNRPVPGPVTSTVTVPSTTEPVEPVTTDVPVEGALALPAAPALDVAAAEPPPSAALVTSIAAPAAAIATPTPSATAQPSTTATMAPPVSGAGVVVLRFTAKSWIRVDDAGGKTLLRGEFPAGQSQTLQGSLPLNLHFGNASGVTAEYQGQPVDFGAYLRDNGTARFTLPLGSN